MLTKLEVKTRQGTQLDLPLEDVGNGYFVEDIEGLDPVKAVLVSSSFANSDGEMYYSNRRDLRTIKLTLALEPDFVPGGITESVRGLRKHLYSFMMPKSEVNLRFYIDFGLYVDIVGRVETFESPMFSKDPQVSVSITCFNPDFVDPQLNQLDGISSANSADVTSELTYLGDVSAGAVITLNANRNLPSFSITHVPPSLDVRQLEFNMPLVSGDKLTISSSPGNKHVTLIRNGIGTSALYGLSPLSAWFELEQGINKFRVYTGTGTGMPYTIEHNDRYGGL